MRFMKLLKISSVIFILIIFLLQSAKAQTFGGNPPSVKWRQINTPAARIIFPAGVDSTAFTVANIINRINPAVKPTIGTRQKLVNIVLQNQTLESNGYVGLAPFRSEFFLTPQQSSFEFGSLPFGSQLAVHEFRHVQQFNNFDVGFTRALHLAFGEGGQALGAALAVPDWLFEGDAVYNETLVTRQGRGRLPGFYNNFRILWAADKNYSYMKLRNGSYLDIIPNHYPLGYMLVAYGRQKYGSNFWAKAGQDAAAYHSAVYPLQSAIRKFTGQNFKQFVAGGLNYFKPQLVTPAQQQAGALLKKRHFEVSEQYPVFADDQTLIYKKSTYRNRPVFVVKAHGKEREIRISDVVNDNYFGYANGKIIYTSLNPDLRWGYRDYNELVIVDISTGRQRRITRRTKYFAPAFNAGADSVVTVEQAPSGKSTLHILKAQDGELLYAVPNPEQLTYNYPKFYKDHQLVAVIRKPDGKTTLALINMQDGGTTDLTPASFTPVGFPVLQKDTVYFTATAGNADRLYSLTIPGKQLYQLQHDSISPSLANYQPAVSSTQLVWVSPDVTGNRLHQVAKHQVVQLAVQQLAPLSDYRISDLSKNPAAHITDDTSLTTALPVRKYPKFAHPFNFHSLIPYFDDPEYTLSLQGQNILNTFTSALDFTYNRNEQYKQIQFSATYGALFPYLFGSAGYTFDRRGYSTRLQQNIYWNEKSVEGGLQVPLNLSSGRYITSLTLSSSVAYSAIDAYATYRPLFRYASYTYVNNTISFSNRVQQARQNVYPHWAQNITLNYRGSVSGIGARQFLATGTFYFQGLTANHGIALSGAWQRRDYTNNIYTNNFPFSRGYTAANLPQMSKVGFNYQLPLAYPDAGIANLVYLLRIRANLFADASRAAFTNAQNQKVQANFRSIGTEVYFDTSWFNEAPVTFGLRYSYLLDDDLFGNRGKHRISFIVPLTIF